MDFRPLEVEERTKLIEALRKNAQEDNALFMRRDTSFTDGLPTDEEVISAIKSVPCHY